MKHHRFVPTRLALALGMGSAWTGMAAVAFGALSGAALAQDVAQAPGQSLTVMGTRAAPRTALESMSPVDIINRAAIEQTATSELVDLLAAQVPAFSVQTLPALDATIFVRPARLRNLSPDQTLVLMNGKRVHRSAMMMNPSYGSAFQAPDLDQIATSALKSIDVLRDGASAQYGSDAIAGVINLNLDDSTDWRAFTQFGRYQAGDGAGLRTGVHGGFRGDKGFAAFTFEYSRDGYTSRSVQSTNAAASQAAYPALSFPNPDVHWGKPERDARRLAFNAAYELNEHSLYTFGTLGSGHGVGDFNYRGPVGSYASVFATNAAFPGWDLKKLYPTGFTPHFISDDMDSSVYVGIRNNAGPDALRYDFSAGYGRNRIDYSMTNSINASMGPASPTSFYDGSVEQVESFYNADFSLPVRWFGFSEPSTLAAGAELRQERFGIIAGDPSSYAFGPAAPALACCSSGFPGYSPVQAGYHSQWARSLYGDMMVPFSKAFVVDAALRYERYSTFGDSLTHKLAARYDFKPFALRATTSTGFRAPTTAQLYSEGLSQFLPSATASITTTGRFSPVGPVAQILNQRAGVNIAPLKPEESNNYSLGLVFDLDQSWSGSVDFYSIDIKNRLNTSTSYVLTAAENAALTALKIPNLQNIYSANFLQNDFNTSTRGVDLVLQRAMSLWDGKANASLAYSRIDTKVTGGSRTANPYSRQMYEDSLPKQRATGTFTFGREAWDYLARVRYYGSWSDWTDTFPNTAAPGSTYPNYDPQVFRAITFFDASVAYRFSNGVKLMVGADNLFNTYPDKARWQTFRGLVYSRNSPYSTDGGYYFARLSARF